MKLYQYDTVMTKYLLHRCLSFEKAEGALPRHAAIFWHPCAYYFTRTLVVRCCKLQFVTVININYISGLLRRSGHICKNIQQRVKIGE